MTPANLSVATSAAVSSGTSQARSRLRNICSTMCRKRLVTTMVVATIPAGLNIRGLLPAPVVKPKFT